MSQTPDPKEKEDEQPPQQGTGSDFPLVIPDERDPDYFQRGLDDEDLIRK